MAEDSEDDFEILLRELRRGGYELNAQRVATAAELRAAFAHPWDLVISDWMMPGFGGRIVLELLAKHELYLPVIVISGTTGEEPAVEALRAGALDFLSKDKPKRFVPAVQRALREGVERRARLVAEQELRFSEERYRRAFEISPEPLLTFDLDRLKVIDANSKALELFRRTRSELHTLDLGQLSPEYIAAAQRGESPVFQWTLQIAGELVPTETRIDLLPTTGRNLARISIADLRERLRSEEIRRRSHELEMQNRRIQEASRLKSEFLANMSHELRTPLNAIIGFAELLHDGQVDPDSPQHTEFLDDILTSGRHLLQLINDVLDLAKVEAGKLDFRPEQISLARVIGEVAAILRTSAASKRIRVAIDVDPTLDDVSLDPARLKQVIYNYLSNALKFTGPGGTVTVRVKPEGSSRLRLEVEDTGVGVAPEDLGRLFVEFQQLEAGSAKRHQGTGLGLALTRRLVEAQGGEVGVTSTLERGSTFHAILPRRSPSGIQVIMPVLPEPRDGARTVLVVEDDVRDQAQLVSALAGAGYAVELASTGAEALTRWRARAFDAITLDLLLPDMSGLELLAALHGERRSITVPIIVVTVVPDAKVIAGFTVHDILHKPLDRDSLVASLTRAGVAGMVETV